MRAVEASRAAEGSAAWIRWVVVAVDEVEAGHELSCEFGMIGQDPRVDYSNDDVGIALGQIPCLREIDRLVVPLSGQEVVVRRQPRAANPVRFDPFPRAARTHFLHRRQGPHACGAGAVALRARRAEAFPPALITRLQGMKTLSCVTGQALGRNVTAGAGASFRTRDHFSGDQRVVR